eukprot:2644051-Rhodomonas_salina.6
MRALRTGAVLPGGASRVRSRAEQALCCALDLRPGERPQWSLGCRCAMLLQAKLHDTHSPKSNARDQLSVGSTLCQDSRGFVSWYLVSVDMRSSVTVARAVLTRGCGAARWAASLFRSSRSIPSTRLSLIHISEPTRPRLI